MKKESGIDSLSSDLTQKHSGRISHPNNTILLVFVEQVKEVLFHLLESSLALGGKVRS